jgi:hypothetical protein
MPRCDEDEIEGRPLRRIFRVSWNLARTLAFLGSIQHEKLQRELGFLATDIPLLLRGILGEEINKAAVYAWPAWQGMTVERLVQLLTIVRIKTGAKLDVWEFLDVGET